jgi:amino acid adenylation domain-containing protein/non-ribosomal peptide synthase protein (TIGR01720 family)
LTNPQRRIWFTELVNNHVDMSNIGYAIELKGHYDLQLLARAISQVVKVNTGLQLRFRPSEEDKSELMQYFPEYMEADVSILEASSEEELYRKLEEKHRRRYDVTANQLCSFCVFSINGERFGLFEKAHHMVADGISAVIVAREALATYKEMLGGTFEEKPKDYQYMDFLVDENEYIAGPKYIKDRNYWLERFEDFEGDEITFSTNRNANNSLKVNRRSFRIPKHMIESLDRFMSDKPRLTNFALFKSALAIYFNRFMGHDDIVIGMPVHNRSKKFRDMVGMFVSTVPFRIRYDENWSFNDLLDYIKKELWDTLKHQSFPYNHLVKELKDRDIETDGLLNVQLIELPGGDQEEVVKRTFYNTAYNITQLSVYLNQQNSKSLEELDIAVDYHADLFEEREIDVLFKRLMVILEQAASEPDRKLSELSLLEETETRRLVSELNETDAPYPEEKTLHQLFAEQVNAVPDNIALEYEGQTVTYRQLNEVTDKLAARLAAAGVKPDTIVGMLSERSIEAIVSILSVLKAGGAYVPIDPEYPLERKNYIIQNSNIDILLVEKRLEQRETELFEANGGINKIAVDYAALVEEPAAEGFQPPAITSDNLAYVIYTSGTTGNPKGTLLRHRNVMNYICWGAGHYVAGQPSTFPLFTSLSFDLTVTSIFIPLVTGNKLVIYRESDSGLLIERVIEDNKVDIIKLTPSHLKVVNQMKTEAPRVRSFILGGEELTTALSAEVEDHFDGNINIYNEYGPTETAVGCMIHRYDRTNDTARAVPIGKPSNNVRIYILDKNKNLLPQGIVGEIYIAGKGVARGYLNRDDLTNEKFVDNPFTPGEKMYRSGDLGRWNLDDVLEFFGRVDEQVKIRGYRIEPGEIEKQLVKLEGIKDAVVAVRKTNREQPELCAYLQPLEDNQNPENQDLEVTRIRERLSRELPAYMLPSEFVQVDSIPLTRNAKVDLRKLEKMGRKLESSHEFIAPRDDMETMLADIWAAVLGPERVGITDNFFELGGDSIKAVQIAARMNDAGKTVNVKDILTHQTITNLCANVDFDSHIRKYRQDTIEGEKKLTPIEGWFLTQHFADPNHYHQSALLEFKKPVDVPTLEKTIGKLLLHHDGLRLNYDKEKNLFFFNNKLLDKLFKVEVIDLTATPEPERPARIETLAGELKASFDIENGDMLKAILFKAEPAQDKLLLVLHHLVTDGITWRILLEDLYSLYDAYATTHAAGNEPDLPQKTASLLDWYDALALYRDSGKLEDQLDYWKTAENSDFHLPYDHEPANVDWSVKNTATSSIELDKDNTGFLLKEAHDVYKTDVQILVTTALVRTLRQWTGKSDVTVEMENHGRHIEDIDTNKTIGWFTAIYPLHINHHDNSIGDEIKTVKESIRKMPNNGIGYGIMKYMSDSLLNKETKRAEIRFNYLGQFDSEVENPLFSYCRQSTGTDIAPDNHMTAAIEINAMIMNDVLTAEINYNKEAFTSATIDSFGSDYINNLIELLDHIKSEDDVHFTSSDFDTVDLSDDDLAALFE